MSLCYWRTTALGIYQCQSKDVAVEEEMFITMRELSIDLLYECFI